MGRTTVVVGVYLGALVALDLADAGGELLLGYVRTVGRDGMLLTGFVVFVLLRGPVPGLILPAATAAGRALQVAARVGFVVAGTVALLGFAGVLPRLLPGFGAAVGLAAVLVVIALVHRARGRTTNPFEMMEFPTAGMYTLVLLLALFGPSFGDPIATPLRAGLAVVAGMFGVVFLAPRLRTMTADVPAGRWFTLGGMALAGLAVAIDGGLSLDLTIAVGLVVLPALVVFTELWELAQRSPDRVSPARYLAGFDNDRDEVLHRIKGTYRRALVAEHYGSDESLDAAWHVHDLGDGDKMWLQAQHPQARGGEDLPNLDDGEVEIARLTYTDTVHGEVVSLRIRSDEDTGQHRLRLVDEYGTDFALPTEVVDRPLRSDDLVSVFRDATPSPLEVSSGYRYQSLFHSDLAERSPTHQEAVRQVLADTGWFSIGMAVRTWARRLAVSAYRTARATLDFSGWSSGYDAIAWAFVAGFAYRLSLAVAERTSTDWLTVSVAVLALAPVPALITRRVRDIRPERLRRDLRWLLMPVAGGAALLLLGPGAPLGWALAIPAVLITLLYLLLRPGDVDPIARLDLDPART